VHGEASCRLSGSVIVKCHLNVLQWTYLIAERRLVAYPSRGSGRVGECGSERVALCSKTG